MKRLLYNDLTNLVQTQNFASQSMQCIVIGANHCAATNFQIFEP